MIYTIDRDSLIHGLTSSISPEVMPAALVRTCVATMRRLAGAHPVSASDLASALGVPAGDIGRQWEMLRSYGMAQLDPQGRVIGMILSLSGTPHRFLVDGRQLHTWCALDTLFMPAVLGTEATIESACPLTGATVRLRMAPTSVVAADPPSTVVSVVVPGKTPGITAACGPDLVGAAGAFCQNVWFLASEDAGRRWLETRPGGSVLSLDEAFGLAQHVWAEPFLRHAPDASV